MNGGGDPCAQQHENEGNELLLIPILSFNQKLVSTFKREIKLLSHLQRVIVLSSKHRRIFYVRIHLFAIRENILEHGVCEICIRIPRLIFDYIDTKQKTP